MVEGEFRRFHHELSEDPDDQDQHSLSEVLAKHDQGNFLRGIAEAILQLIMESDVEGSIGAGRDARSAERTTWRNGYSHQWHSCGRVRLEPRG